MRDMQHLGAKTGNRDETVTKWRGLLALGLVLTAGPLVGSASSATSSVPPEFLPACGHPGSEVRVLRAAKAPLVIRHRACDVRGVIVLGVATGVEIPRRAGGMSASATNGVVEEQLTVQVARTTLDVTVSLVLSA